MERKRSETFIVEKFIKKNISFYDLSLFLFFIVDEECKNEMKKEIREKYHKILFHREMMHGDI